MSLKVSKLNFLINHKKARTIFSFELKIENRPIHEDEIILLDLDVLNHDNPTYIPKIIVKDLLNNSDLSNDFKSAERILDNFNKVILTPKKALLEKNKHYLIEIHNVYVPTTGLEYGISAYLQNAIG